MTKSVARRRWTLVRYSSAAPRSVPLSGCGLGGKHLAHDPEDVDAPPRRTDVALGCAGKEEQADAVVVADRGEGEDGTEFGGESSPFELHLRRPPPATRSHRRRTGPSGLDLRGSAAPGARPSARTTSSRSSGCRRRQRKGEARRTRCRWPRKMAWYSPRKRSSTRRRARSSITRTRLEQLRGAECPVAGLVLEGTARQPLGARERHGHRRHHANMAALRGPR